jgi:hypothetical protein
LGLLAAVGTAPWLGCSGTRDPSPGAAPGGPEHLRLIAGAVRAADPSLDALDAGSAAAELGLGGDHPADGAEWDRLAASVRERVHEDFAGGRTVLAEGWLLSRTEALLAVAAS